MTCDLRYVIMYVVITVPTVIDFSVVVTPLTSTSGIHEVISSATCIE